MNMLGQNESRRVAHADPHTVIINDTTTNTGEIGWYRLSLAEFLAGKYYDGMGPWHFNTGDILGNGTATPVHRRERDTVRHRPLALHRSTRSCGAPTAGRSRAG